MYVELLFAWNAYHLYQRKSHSNSMAQVKEFEREMVFETPIPLEVWVLIALPQFHVSGGAQGYL